MIKYSYTIFCLLLITFTSSAQKNKLELGDVASVKWSEEIKSSFYHLKKIVGKYNKKYYILKFSKTKELKDHKSGYILEEYDSDMTYSREVQFPLVYQGEECNYQDAFVIGGKLVVFSNFVSKEKSNLYLYESIDLETLKIDNNQTVIATEDLERKRRPGGFVNVVSQNSSKLLLSYFEYNKDREPEKFNLRAYNSDLELLWRKDITLNKKEEEVEFIDIEVDDSGSAWVLTRQDKDLTRQEKKEEINWEYHLQKFGKGNSDSLDILINPGKDEYVIDASIMILKSGDIVCPAFYSRYNKTIGIKGVYVMKISNDEVAFQSTYGFSEDFVGRFHDQREYDKIDKKNERKDHSQELGLPDFDMHSIISDKHGNMVLLSEDRKRMNVTSTSSSGHSRNDTYYFLKDILAIGISATGEIKWANIIPKKQSTKNDRGAQGSFNVVLSGDKIYLVYPEEYLNYAISKFRYDQLTADDNSRLSPDVSLKEKSEIKKSIPSFSRQDPLLVVHEIDFNGSVVFHDPIYNLFDIPATIRPFDNSVIRHDELFLFGMVGLRKYVVGILKITN